MEMDCCSTESTDEASANMTEALSVDPVNAPETHDDPQHKCQTCGSASRPVTRKTTLLMVKPEHFDRVAASEYRFCPDRECRVVYFSEDGSAPFMTGDLRLRVGLKERSDPILLCYCFGLEEKDARDEIERSGASTMPQRITALINQKMCACPSRNPSGACCLGEVNKTIKMLTAAA